MEVLEKQMRFFDNPKFDFQNLAAMSNILLLEPLTGIS